MTSLTDDPLRILLVDDDRVLSLYHVAVLEAAGFAVRHVTKPSEALDVFPAYNPDLVIVDYHMPEMTGPELATHLRKLPGGGEAGILLITADEQVGTLVSAMKQGISSYLRKPLDQELFPIVSHTLAGNARKIKDSTRHLRLLLAEQKKLEESLLVAKDAAESASRFKSEFLASMSHELRTPLNAILGFAQLFGLDPNLNGETKAHAREIEQAGQHLLSLVNDLIDLARIEAGKLDFVLEPVAVRQALADSQAMVVPIAAKQGVTLIDENGDGVAATICADYVRLRQVMINLLSNAIKYNRPQGTVRLSCRMKGDSVRIDIADTGPGIPEDKQPRIFNAFDRLGAERSTVEGTGIGLVITRRLVEAMGGTIGFDSIEGQGSTFWVAFPLAAPAGHPELEGAASESAQEMESPPASRPVVLYVEDNPLNLRLMQQIFATRTGLELRDAHTAELGIELARAEPPALILMDINLPGMDGYAALARLKADPLTAPIPVIAVSANAMKGDEARGLEAGFSAYLTKPINIPALLAMLDKEIKRNKA